MQLSDWTKEKVLEEGIVSLYKPYGLPSTSVTELYKRALQTKVGHGGTLDPLAEGALILGLGKGTKKLSKYLGGDKTYTATFWYGVSSDSHDLETLLSPNSSLESKIPTIEDVKRVLEELQKPYIQKVPLLSAARIKGKRMYDVVRNGKGKIPIKEINTQLLDVRDVDITILDGDALREDILLKQEIRQDSFNKLKYFAELEHHTLHQKYAHIFEKWNVATNTSIEQLKEFSDKVLELSCTVTVPKGTYIRALTSDIGERLGIKGVLARLERRNTIGVV